MEHILDEIRQERERQHEKWGEQNLKPIEWIAILTEEVGEASKEAVDWHFNNDIIKESVHPIGIVRAKTVLNYRKELIQVAAVAVQMIQCLERNVTK